MTNACTVRKIDKYFLQFLHIYWARSSKQKFKLRRNWIVSDVCILSAPNTDLLTFIYKKKMPEQRYFFVRVSVMKPGKKIFEIFLLSPFSWFNLRWNLIGISVCVRWSEYEMLQIFQFSFHSEIFIWINKTGQTTATRQYGTTALGASISKMDFARQAGVMMMYYRRAIWKIVENCCTWSGSVAKKVFFEFALADSNVALKLRNMHVYVLVSRSTWLDWE